MTRARGFGLVETLVALAIGAFVSIAALSVYARSAADARTNGALQELHESARYAAELIERELREAGYAGLAPELASVLGATPAGEPSPPGLAVAGCAPSMALDFARPVVASNARYALTADVPLGCAPPAGVAWAGGTDTLTIRRANGEPAAPERGRLQIATTRSLGLAIADGAPVAGFAYGTTHDVEVSTYYVAADSVGAPGVPSLRRKRLVGGPSGPRFDDEELAVGIEDLQVEFGVDGPDADEVPERYVVADGIEPSETPRTVRFWLRARAQQRDPSWRDAEGVRLGDHDVEATGDAYRRIVVSRTVFLRNSRRR